MNGMMTSRYAYLRAPDGNAGGSGGTGDGGGGNGNNQGGNNDNQNGNNNERRRENNSGDFSLEDGNIWEQPRREDNNNRGGGNSNNRGNNEGGGNNRNTESDVMANFDTFVGKKDFGFTLDKESIQKMVAEGDVAGLQAAMLKSQRAMYRDIMLDSSRMVNSAVERAVAEAVGKATGNFETDKAKSTLRSMVPLAKNPNIAPVAEAVMSTFIKKGQSHEEAAGNVSKFLNAIRGVKGKEIGVDDPPRNERTSRGGRATDGEDDDSLIDWMQFVKN